MIRVKVGSYEAKEFDENSLAQYRNELDIIDLGHEDYSIIYNNRSHEISILNHDKEASTITLRIDGITTTIEYVDSMNLLLEKLGINHQSSTKMTQLKAPMPGLVVDWYVQVGDSVKSGDKLLLLEAMKMENIIKSSGDGVIKKIHGEKGKAVEKNQLLIEFE